jgi:hypothetical protein
MQLSLGCQTGTFFFPVAFVKIVANLRHELGHAGTVMVARYVGMQVLPDAFNPIVVRTIRGQEMQLMVAVKKARSSN